ncbi:hypothetical protein ACSBR2_012210 [Camellia fascicularis]
MASSSHKFKVLEQCKISPPPGLVPSTTLPLTFFDIPWLLFTPSQPLFFYDFPHSTTTTTTTTTLLSNLKHSLSLTLQNFFPLAGNLTTPPPPTKPHLIYTDSDSISFTVVESTADFNHLSGHHQRHVQEFHHLVPTLPPSVSDSDPHVHPLLAVQVTLFSEYGICIGFTFLHVAADGRTFDNFLKSWASICRVGLDPNPLPSYDRSVIKDPNGIEPILLKRWWYQRSTREDLMDQNGSCLEDMVRATFVVGKPDMEKLKQWILTRSNKIFGSYPLYLSPYVVTCACIWACLTKIRCSNIKSLSKLDPHYFGFIAGGMTRLGYAVPDTYLGNCVSFGRSMAMGSELMGEDGIVIAAKAIGDTVKKLNGAVLGGAENWISDWEELFGSDLHAMVTGSPKLDLYGLDFGWGRPRKIEEIAIDRTHEVSLTESRDGEGGMEVGLVLPRAKMDAFGSLFIKSFNGLK